MAAQISVPLWSLRGPGNELPDVDFDFSLPLTLRRFLVRQLRKKAWG